jgi:nitrate/nitrite transporter NarK
MLAFVIWMLWSVVAVNLTAPASSSPRTSSSG